MEEAFRRDTKYNVIKAEFNPKSGKYVYRIHINGSPPSLDWGIYIGEIAHNLRSALDGLVYQLVLNNKETPTTCTQFPIFLIGRTERKDKDGNRLSQFHRQGRRMLNGVKPEHQAFIEGLQPYKRGRGGCANLLWMLHEVNNADKHRLIQVVGAKSGLITTGLWYPEGSTIPHQTFPVMILKDGAKFGEFSTNVHVNPNIIPLVAFWQGCEVVKKRAVCYTLSSIAEHVGDIVASFASGFS